MTAAATGGDIEEGDKGAVVVRLYGGDAKVIVFNGNRLAGLKAAATDGNPGADGAAGLAQAGGKDKDKLEEALSQVKMIIQKLFPGVKGEVSIDAPPGT